MGAGQTKPVEPKNTGGDGPEVILNIYAPSEGQRSVMGMGIYHTGIQIGSTEYAYGGGSVAASGIYTQTPKESPPGSQWVFKMSQPLGKARVDSIAAAKAVDELRKDKRFNADCYNTLTNNCNHMTLALATKLGVEANYPAWVNKAAKYGAMFSGSSAPPPEERPKSVFETTQGHSLVGDMRIKSSTTASTSSGARPNPWRDPSFKPPGAAPETTRR